MHAKKISLHLLLTLALALTALIAVGCGGGGTGGDKAADTKKTVTVTTSFLQDMTKQLAGDYVNIELIIPAGEDPHLYVAQPADLERWWRLYTGMAVAKRIQSPPLLSVSGCAYGSDHPESQIGSYETIRYRALKEKLLQK